MNKKVYIITGTNRGLGKAFVDSLINNKECFIISISRRINDDQKKYSSDKFYFLKLDLAIDSINQKITVLKDLIGEEPIYFINNASIIEPIVKIEELDEAEIDKTIQVNIKSTILITKFLLKNFKLNSLTFVNISSGAAKRPISNWSLYCSSKAYAQMFFKTAECEYKQHKFFDIDPGVIDTDMQKSLRNNDFPDVEKFKNYKKEGKLRDAIDVAVEILNKIKISE